MFKRITRFYSGSHLFPIASFLLVIVFCLLAISCAKTSREDLLNGSFGTVDTNPPAIISPKSGEKITPDVNGQMKTTLSWESKAGALKYILEIPAIKNLLKLFHACP